MLEEPLGRVEKVASDEVMLRLAIADLLDGVPVQIEEDGVRVAQEDGRVSRDQELRMPGRCEVVDDLEE